MEAHLSHLSVRKQPSLLHSVREIFPAGEDQSSKGAMLPRLSESRPLLSDGASMCRSTHMQMSRYGCNARSVWYLLLRSVRAMEARDV